MFTLQNSFKPLLLKWGRGVISLVELTVNSKEKNSEDLTFVLITSKNSASVQCSRPVNIQDFATLEKRRYYSVRYALEAQCTPQLNNFFIQKKYFHGLFCF